MLVLDSKMFSIDRFRWNFMDCMEGQKTLTPSPSPKWGEGGRRLRFLLWFIFNLFCAVDLTPKSSWDVCRT
jgi:hypothetical protein